jgi:hypothetical protein
VVELFVTWYCAQIYNIYGTGHGSLVCKHNINVKLKKKKILACFGFYSNKLMAKIEK